MATKPARFYVSAGLLYPSALGAALAWLAPAIVDGVRSGGAKPSWWTLLFATWFVLYHALWFVHLVQAADHEEFKYSTWSFVSDLLDVTAIFAAFLCLGLAWPDAEPYIRGGYLTAVLVPLSALVDRKFRPLPAAWWLLVPAVVVPLVAMVAIPRAAPHALDARDWLPLLALYLLLIIYVVKPSTFGSHRGHDERRS